MPHRRRVREEISVFAIFLLTGFILCTGLTPPTWAQSSGDGFSDTLQRYAPEIIDQLNCKPYDLDCQNRGQNEVLPEDE